MPSKGGGRAEPGTGGDLLDRCVGAIEVAHLRSVLNTGPLDDLHDASTPAPVPVDDHGRSDQQFIVDIVADCGTVARRATARGRDIYAVSAPLIVEGALRLLDGRVLRLGAAAPGQAFDAADLLHALEDGPTPSA